MLSSGDGGRERSDGDRREPWCPICLEHVKQEARLDRCFHVFCYDCIVRWSKIVSKKLGQIQPPSSVKCPICKVDSFSIIQVFNGGFFQRQFVTDNFQKSFLSNAHVFRLQFYSNEPGIKTVFNVQQYWKLCKYMNKNIWIPSWLKRELQALIQEEDVDIIVHHILGTIDFFIRRQYTHANKGDPKKKQEEFSALVSDAARPFLHGKTQCFVNELEAFLASGLNIEAYDGVCMQKLSTRTSPQPEEYH